MASLNWAKANADARMRQRGSESISGTSSGHRSPSRPRSAPAAPGRPVLSAPVTISEFWANRSGQSIRVQLREFQGRVLADVRKYYTDAQGRLQPTEKGLSISIRKLPELAAAINKAVAKAIALGLIDGKEHADG